MSTVTQHTDTYWTNRYGCRFSTEKEALDDEAQRTTRPLKLAVIHMGEFMPPVTEVVGWSAGLFGNNAPYSEITRVHLLQDVVAYCQEQIAKHGDVVGYTRRHHGMGQYMDDLCTVQPNPLYEKA